MRMNSRMRDFSDDSGSGYSFGLHLDNHSFRARLLPPCLNAFTSSAVNVVMEIPLQLNWNSRKMPAQVEQTKVCSFMLTWFGPAGKRRAKDKS